MHFETAMCLPAEWLPKCLARNVVDYIAVFCRYLSHCAPRFWIVIVLLNSASFSTWENSRNSTVRLLFKSERPRNLPWFGVPCLWYTPHFVVSTRQILDIRISGFPSVALVCSKTFPENRRFLALAASTLETFGMFPGSRVRYPHTYGFAIPRLWTSAVYN